MRIEMLTYIASLLLLQFHKISAYDTGNIALNKPATQVSTYSEGTHQWSASHAVDGDKSCGDPPTWQHYSATKSDSFTGTWWRVDLQEEYNISRVVVHGKPTDTN
ncbi:fucolectin-6-like, partial [Mercenaria mercenaria]|uniref:fucolectin-6-like n=1 Tax=Mercenaria mercenaria TaxID=6596 RepID=UPI00234F126F